jgi:hypothetical protein
MKVLLLTLAFIGTVLATTPSAQAEPYGRHWHHRYWHHYWHHHYGYEHHRGYWAYRNGVQIFVPL